jgi:hypothetical protein
MRRWIASSAAPPRNDETATSPAELRPLTPTAATLRQRFDLRVAQHLFHAAAHIRVAAKGFVHRI